MINELLLLFKRHTDTLIEQTKTKPQETLEFAMTKQIQTFSFSPPLNLLEEGKWLLGMSSFTTTNSVFNITDKNNPLSISISSYWRIPKNLEDNIIDKLKILLKHKSENDIKLHVQEVRKRRNQTKSVDKEYKLRLFDTSKNEIREELENTKYHDLEDLVYRMQLTYDEIIYIFDIKTFLSKKGGYTLPPGIYEVIDISTSLKHILPNDAKLTITIDGVRLKSNLKVKS